MEVYSTRAVYLVLLTIILTAVMFNIPVLQTIGIHGFDDGTYSHAYLIPFLSFYLLYVSVSERRIELRKKPSMLWLVAFAFASYGFFVATNAQISLGYWLGWLAIITLAPLVVFRFSLHLVFPFAYLIFLLPVWGTLSGMLQFLSVNVVSFVMEFTGVPTYVEETFIHIPSGVFEIANGCSGLRYFIVSIAISSIYVFLFINRTSVAIKLFLFAIVGALLTNWLRIILLILIGHFTEMQSSLMEDHNMFGWYLYLPYMVLFFFLANKWTERNEPTEPSNNNDTNMNGSLWVALSLVLIVFVGSSSSIHKTLMPDRYITESLGEIEPTFYYVSSINQCDLLDKFDSCLEFRFDGRWLDGKPTYYENRLVPETLKVIDRGMQGNISYFLTERITTRQRYIIGITLTTGTEEVSSKNSYKLASLMQSMLTAQPSSVLWYLKACINQYTCKLPVTDG